MSASTRASSPLLRVAEVFGPTFQGEGPSAGQRALFIRLSGCNLDCGWCDTPYTWDWRRFDRGQEAHDLPVDALVRWILSQDAGLVVITGGEPLIQQRKLVGLIEDLVGAGRRVEIETNGTIMPDSELVDLASALNVSPKLAGSGVAEPRRIKPAVLSNLRDHNNVIFKFVIASHHDLTELVELQTTYRLRRVWVMPEGTTEREILDGLRLLAAPAVEHGWNLSPRLHVLLWGDERGR